MSRFFLFILIDFHYTCWSRRLTRVIARFDYSSVKRRLEPFCSDSPIGRRPFKQTSTYLKCVLIYIYIIYNIYTYTYIYTRWSKTFPKSRNRRLVPNDRRLYRTAGARFLYKLISAKSNYRLSKVVCGEF